MSAAPSLALVRDTRIALLGTGTVGAAFARRVARLRATSHCALTLDYVANSRGAAYAKDGLDPVASVEVLGARARVGRDARPPELPPGTVVVDATACGTLAAAHPRWLARGHAVVSANKLGLGGPLARFLEIRAVGRESLAADDPLAQGREIGSAHV